MISVIKNIIFKHVLQQGSNLSFLIIRKTKTSITNKATKDGYMIKISNASLIFFITYLENFAFNLKQTTPAITTITTTETVIGITIIMTSKNKIRETIQHT